MFVALGLSGALLAAPPASAAATQDFHLMPDMSLGLGPGEDFEVPITAIVGEDTSYWSRTMQSGGAMLPAAGTIQVRIKDANLASAAASGEVCPLRISVGIAGESYVYWCTWIDSLGSGVTPAGDYTVTFELSNPDIEPIGFAAGDELYVWLVTSSSQVAVPSAFVVGGSLVSLTGTAEPVEPAPESEPEQGNTTQTTSSPPTAPGQSSSSTSKPPSGTTPSGTSTSNSMPTQHGSTAKPVEDAKSSPSVSIAVILALVGLGFAMRRRLA
jgi:hypothetical protein